MVTLSISSLGHNIGLADIIGVVSAADKDIAKSSLSSPLFKKR